MKIADSARFQLYSPLSPAECVSRLAAAIDTEPTISFSPPDLDGSKPVIGRVSETGLRLRKRIEYANAFQSHLVATLGPEAGGTVISGEVGLRPFVRKFWSIWLGFGIIFCCLVIPIVVGGKLLGLGNTSSGEAWIFAVAPPAMIAGGYCFVRWGCYLARDEARFLTDFLKRTLDAHSHDQTD